MFPNDIFSMFDAMLNGSNHNELSANRLLARLDANARQALINANKFSNQSNSTHTNTEHLFLSVLEILAHNNVQLLCERPKEMFEFALNNIPNLNQQVEQQRLSLSSDLLSLIQRAVKYNPQGVTLETLIQILVNSKNEFVKNVLSKFKSPVGESGQSNSLSSDLSEFGVDLTELAKQGKINPIIGREEEIQRAINILCRKQKNNPILLGEPGVGKTAIAEGLALKIINKEVPAAIENKKVFALDLTSMLADTQYRGSFEKKAKQLIEALSKDKDTILFIDEIHTIVGAGAGESKLDLANMIKPALARGELACIGATTLMEYKKYFSVDAALERRFQTVDVKEPSVNDAIEILRGIKSNYEKHHDLTIEDEAIVSAVTLSDRYIKNRFLPDKAIDIIDEACAKLSLQKNSDEKCNQDEIEKQIEDAVKVQDFKKAADLKATLANAKTNCVDSKLIEDIVSKMAKMPVGKVGQDEKKLVMELEERLNQSVIGQASAVNMVANCIKRAKAGLSESESPLGAFLFLGPTGVGKTQLAKALAANLFGDSSKIIRLDMSEFMDAHSSSKIIGSPPGYVGFEDGGFLTEKITNNPYSIVLLDEIEKAHPSILNLFLQLLDDGRLTDNKGRTVDFSNTIIIATSNVGAKYMTNNEVENDNENEFAINTELKSKFSPEFLNRFDEIIRFESLSKEHISMIIGLEVDKLNKKLAKQNLSIELNKQALEQLSILGFNPEFGARPLKRVIKREIESVVADLILTGNAEANIKIGFDEEKGFYQK